MSDNRFKINHKEQRAVAGNWGKPDKTTQKNTNIPDPLYPKQKRKASKKYKKKLKKIYLSPYESCPFCKTKLRNLPKEDIDSSSKFTIFFCYRYEKICRQCGAKKVEECPSCHYPTWYLDEIYKHQYNGCGFEGKRINKNKHIRSNFDDYLKEN